MSFRVKLTAFSQSILYMCFFLSVDVQHYFENQLTDLEQIALARRQQLCTAISRVAVELMAQLP